ncbi:acyl-CoA dehydrogenase family protein, partial [Pseudomonas aeruginosa]|uniref:acyl-CoA dehydrogenase family protein n=1 Tax=Pseudomonas aeruginosa TaxID=287 RepID=UPI0031B72ECD
SMLGVPEEFGGIPADYVTQMLALMEVSKCGAPAFLITNGQCIHSMRRFGSAEQLRKTAESTLETGDPAYALALTEPGAGSDNNSPLPLTRVKTARFTSTDRKPLLPVRKSIHICWC